MIKGTRLTPMRKTATHSMPKIAYYVQRFPQISQGFVYNQMAAPHDMGWDTKVIACRCADASHIPQEASRCGYMERRSYLDWAATEIALARKLLGNTLTRKLLEFRHQVHSRRHTQKPLRFPGGNYDIIHAQFGYSGTVALQHRQLGMIEGPILTAFRGYDLTGFYRLKGPHYYDALKAEGDLFLPSCHYFKEMLIADGFPTERVKVIYSGINTTPLEHLPRPRGGDADEVVRVLSVGRLTAKKGFDVGIKAFAKAAAQCGNLRYCIVGGGDLDKELRELAATLGVLDRIEFAGEKDQEAVYPYLAKSDIFLHPSVTPASGDMDGAANAPKEGAAAGLPVIVSNHGGLKEVIEQGSGGYVVQEKDSDTIADHLISLAQDASLRTQMGVAARARALALFKREHINQQIMETYQEFLA